MSKLLSMMMSSSGGGVEFKTSIYATDGAYIQTDINISNVTKIRAKGENISYQAQSGSRRFVCQAVDVNSGYNGISVYIGYYNNPTIQVTLAFFQNSYSASKSSYENLINENTFDLILNNFTFTTPVVNTFSIFKDAIYGQINFELFEFYDQNDNLLHELKPAIVNGESGMYDTVTETFYGNANSVGSLVCE